ncbi:MAG: UDP-3-O-acyl-N-acetylglucosamine deacetylase [Gemmatales bacterium]|nr:UDP-3-O-acyl-N-acetylglucosamine deacetylase [Gemmatales bacterium]MDW8387812.1 UDP-3-O-acyl-N-acetylglucosamine deacetylase [Gemmatales bacterium]
MTLRCVGQRCQRTIRETVEVHGYGYRTGAAIRVRFRPACPGTGIVFVRTDVPGAKPISAAVGNVTGTNRRTTLGQPPAQVEMVEHVLAALHGLKIDNCLIEINGPELPGLDGSSRDFVRVLCAAGLRIQKAVRNIWAATEAITIVDGRGSLSLYPASAMELRASYLLDYGQPSPIPAQRQSAVVGPEGFLNEVASSRTFLLEAEAEALRGQGFGRNTSPADLLVFGTRGPINNRLRYADEPARHKILDIVGDLALFGEDLAGHVVGCRSGHSLNVALVRRLRETMELSSSSVREASRAA